MTNHTQATVEEVARDLANACYDIAKPRLFDDRLELARQFLGKATAILALPSVGWRFTADELPEKPGLKPYEHVDCLICYRGEVIKRPWNCEHLCWDDEHYDDFFCPSTDPVAWMPLPAPPQAVEDE